MTAYGWSDFERFGRLMALRPFQFAKTMPRNPHWYTPRQKWLNNDEFTWAAGFIYDFGYPTVWWGKPYKQMDLNGWTYWAMGAPRHLTGVINRKPLAEVSPWDAYGERPRFPFARLGNMAGNTLEVGWSGLDEEILRCQTIDWSKQQNPHYVTPLSSFVPQAFSEEENERFDFIGSMYGAYLSPEEQERIPSLLTPGGVAQIYYRTHTLRGTVPTFEPIYEVDSEGWACVG